MTWTNDTARYARQGHTMKTFERSSAATRRRPHWYESSLLKVQANPWKFIFTYLSRLVSKHPHPYLPVACFQRGATQWSLSVKLFKLPANKIVYKSWGYEWFIWRDLIKAQTKRDCERDVALEKEKPVIPCSNQIMMTPSNPIGVNLFLSSRLIIIFTAW